MNKLIRMFCAKSKTELLPPGREKELLGVIRRLLGTNYPNPDRIGCADFSKDIRALAWHKKLENDFNRVLDHVRHCSPCFREHGNYLDQYKVHRRFQHILKASAVLILFGIGMFLIKGEKIKELVANRELRAVLDDKSTAAGYAQGSPNETGQDVPTPVERQIALLNLNSTLRDGNGPEIPPAELPRRRLTLSIQLPKGARAGNYKVRLFRNLKTPLVEAEGMAQIDEQNSTFLRIQDFDTSGISPGKYLLGLKRGQLDWVEFSVKVK